MAERPSYNPHFLESADTITKRMTDNIPDEWHKEPGDFIYDAMKTNPAEIIQLEENQDHILRNAFPQYCDDERLDDLLQLYGLTRIPATHTIRKLSITADAGVKIPQGYTLTSVVLDDNGNPLQYAVKNETVFTDTATTKEVYIVCHQAGAIGNIVTGSDFILQPPIPGVRSIVDLGVNIAGVDRESADDFWTRYLDTIANPDTGGNVNDYKRWVINDFAKDTGYVIKEVIPLPRFKGPGTVQLVAVGGNYEKLSDELLSILQEYIDPLEYQGLGYGKAPCGAAVTVSTGTEKPINISVRVALSDTAIRSEVLQQFKDEVSAYIQTRVFKVDEETKKLYPITYFRIVSILGNIKGIDDFYDLTLNGGTVDVPMEFFDIPTLGEVVFND